jgi:hypothetical protein
MDNTTAEKPRRIDAEETAFVEKSRKGRTFTFVRFEDSGRVEESITTHKWDEELANIARMDGTVVTFRPATENEIIEFILSGRMQDEDDGDAEFDRGYNEAKEGWY